MDLSTGSTYHLEYKGDSACSAQHPASAHCTERCFDTLGSQHACLGLEGPAFLLPSALSVCTFASPECGVPGSHTQDFSRDCMRLWEHARVE